MHRLLITNAVVYFYYTVYSVYTLDGLSVNYFYGSYSLLIVTIINLPINLRIQR